MAGNQRFDLFRPQVTKLAIDPHRTHRKGTGVGDREMAEEGINFFTEIKTVFINYSGRAERLMIR